MGFLRKSVSLLQFTALTIVLKRGNSIDLQCDCLLPPSWTPGVAQEVQVRNRYPQLPIDSPILFLKSNIGLRIYFILN